MHIYFSIKVYVIRWECFRKDHLFKYFFILFNRARILTEIKNAPNPTSKNKTEAKANSPEITKLSPPK